METKICQGSCKEKIPLKHEGKYTESARTVVHHAGGVCHYLGDKSCRDCTHTLNLRK